MYLISLRCKTRALLPQAFGPDQMVQAYFLCCWFLETKTAGGTLELQDKENQGPDTTTTG